MRSRPFYQAVKCHSCDWAIRDNMGVPIDDCSSARRLAILAMLSAESSFRRGDDRAGLDDRIAVMTPGRHLGRGIYIAGMAGFPIDGLAVTKALEAIARLNPSSRCAFAERLDSLPAFPELAQAVRAEETYFRRE